MPAALNGVNGRLPFPPLSSEDLPNDMPIYPDKPSVSIFVCLELRGDVRMEASSESFHDCVGFCQNKYVVLVGDTSSLAVHFG